MKIEATSSWFGALVLLGGLGLFLFGMHLLSEGLQLASGERLRKILETLTRNRLRGTAVGAIVTALIQSSSATTVMLVGFVNAGLMTFTQSVPVIFGANIGTTVTAQIVAFDVKTLSFPCLAVGFLMYMLGSKRKIKYAGQAILGFGVLFLGIELMKGAMAPFKNSGAFESWIQEYGSNPLLGLLLGLVTTSIIQSSSATTGMLVAMASAGLLGSGGVDSLRIAIPIILGCNIGTCITAWIASLGASLPAKRVAVAHYLFNISGSFIFLPLTPWFARLVMTVSKALGAGPENVARQVAWAHTLFNVIITLFWLPLLNQFVTLVKWAKRGKEPLPERDPLFLDPRIFHNPSVALEMARKEISRMARVTLNMLKTSVGFLEKMERGGRKTVLEQESIVDGLAHSITDYLTRLSQEALSDEQSETLAGFMHAVNDVERIGDHAENIMYLATTKKENDLNFSEEAKRELENISSTVFRMYEGIIEAFEQEKPEQAREYQSLEHEVDQMASQFRRNHIKRLNLGQCDGQAGVIFLDTLSNLERVGDLANNLGHVTTGALERL
jgi:phosphate:Na+ symporter